jgi:predicted membrane-bound dolichyl-phosphate-mannose-protein mannosyltransferase
MRRRLHCARRLPASPSVVLVLILLISVVTRVVFLSDESLIFDEFAYVNAARVILGRPATLYTNQPAGLDPNQEHPPLGKLLIAASMRLFGDGPLGWRFPSLVAGVAAILLTYAIVRALGGDSWLALLAAGIFSFDNLVLVQSRIAMLDMPLVALLLLGAWLSLRGRPWLGGAVAALASLVKLVGVYGLLAIVIYDLASADWPAQPNPSQVWAALRPAVCTLISFAIVWFLGLWALDLRFSALHTPWVHLHYMLHFGFAYAALGNVGGVQSGPWQWLINQVQIPYLHLLQPVSANGRTVYAAPVYFWGAMNPFIVWTVLPGLGFAVWSAVRSRSPVAIWSLCWFGANYLPYYPLALIGHRLGYIYYFLPALPAVAVSLALLLRSPLLPRFVLWGYLALVLIGFVWYYPFRVLLR